MWFENWTEIIDPCINGIQQKIARGDNRPMMDLLFNAQKMGFYLGVLVGCKSMGASRDDLIRKGQAWALDPVLWLTSYAAECKKENESTIRRETGKKPGKQREVSHG